MDENRLESNSRFRNSIKYILVNSKWTIITILIIYILYIYQSDKFYLVVLGLIGCLYLILSFPTSSTSDMKTHPYVSGYSDSVRRTQQRESSFLLSTTLFDLTKSIIMILLGFGHFIVVNSL